MKAFILAAGLGTRLKPITNKLPKALVKLNGIPLLEIVIKKLIAEKENVVILLKKAWYVSMQVYNLFVIITSIIYLFYYNWTK